MLNMSREILMYIYPSQYPILRQEEGKKIEVDKSIEDQPSKIDFLVDYYNSISESFNEKYEKIISHSSNPKTKLDPMFWDHPELKFVARSF